MKSHILQEAALLTILTEHGGSGGVNLEKKSLVQGVYYRSDGLQTHLLWRVRNKKPWTPRNGNPWFQVALLWQAGQYHSGQNITLATRGTAMTMKTNNDKRTARWSRQQSSNGQFTENGNHTEKTQHGPTPVPPNIRLTMTQETNVINGSDGAKRKWKKLCGVLCT
jgi:hypothetical protein